MFFSSVQEVLRVFFVDIRDLLLILDSFFSEFPFVLQNCLLGLLFLELTSVLDLLLHILDQIRHLLNILVS